MRPYNRHIRTNLLNNIIDSLLAFDCQQDAINRSLHILIIPSVAAFQEQHLTRQAERFETTIFTLGMH